MKRTVFILVAIAFAWRAASGAAPVDEAQCVSVLQGDDSLQAKDAACARLKWIGTARCVPIVAPYLTNDDLSHSARYTLESLPGSAAEKALLHGLQITSGSNRVGIVNSLAVRRDPQAIPPFEHLLADSDLPVAVAAAEGLGRIGGSRALRILQAGAPRSTGPLHGAEIDGILACANQLMHEGRNSQAGKTFQWVFDREQAEPIHVAAYRGLILCAGDRAQKMILDSIAGSDAPEQGVALALANHVTGQKMTRALAAMLGNSSMPVQLALLQCLAQRADPIATPSIAALITSGDPNARVAAIQALGQCGDESVALDLAKAAASSKGAERTEARQALVDLRRGPVAQTIVAALPAAPDNVRLELIRALGDRADSSAAPEVLKWAETGDDATAAAAFQAMSELGGTRQVQPLLQLIIQTTNDDQRSQAADALGFICRRVQEQGEPWDVQSLARALNDSPTPVRIALLPECSSLGTDATRNALRACLTNSDPELREAALHALCDTSDVGLMPDLVAMACDAPEKKSRILAVRGCVRLVTSEQGVKLPEEQKIEPLKKILGTPLDASEKKLVLSALSAVPGQESLELAGRMLDDRAVKMEAAQAVIHIAGSISNQQPDQAGAALKKVLAMSLNSATHKSAERAFQKIQMQ